MDLEAEPVSESVRPRETAAVEAGKTDKRLETPNAPNSKAPARSRKPAALSTKPAAARTTKTAARGAKPAAEKTALAAQNNKPAKSAETSDGVALAALGATVVPLLATLFGRSDPPAASTDVGRISSESLSDIIAATQRLGVDGTAWDFKQLTSLIQQAGQYQREQRAQDDEAAAKQRQLDAQAKATENEYKLKTRETNVRFAIALILVLGAVVGVFAGIVVGLDAGEVAQYVAPITGLAGIAVGYFFGRASQ